MAEPVVSHPGVPLGLCLWHISSPGVNILTKSGKFWAENSLKIKNFVPKALFSIGYNHIRFHWKYCPLVTSPGDIIVSPFLQMSIFSQDAGWKYWGKQEIIWVKTLARKYAQFLLFGWQILTRCFLLFPIFSRSTFSWRWCFDDVTQPLPTSWVWYHHYSHNNHRISNIYLRVTTIIAN